MAVLSNQDYRDIKKRIRANAAVKVGFNAMGLNKATWMALFQVVEDWFVNGFSGPPSVSFKTAVESIAGAVTNIQAKQVGFVWMGWRYTANP